MFAFLRKKSTLPYLTIGITGMYGKTVVAKVISNILTANGIGTAYLTSEGFSPINGELDTRFTSDNLDVKSFQEIKQILKRSTPQIFVIEVPLNILQRKFIDEISFDTGIITTTENWTKRLDNESVFDNALLKFINNINNNGLLVVNGDEPYLMNWLNNNSHHIHNNIFCSYVSTTELKEKKFSLNGISFMLHDQINIESKLIGKHNFINMYLAAQACLRFMDITSITNGIANVTNPAGSFDMYNVEPFKIIIDSAKTPQQLADSLYYLSQTKSPRSSLITVLGSPYYETSERKINAELATRFSDIVLFAPNDPNNLHVSNINSELHGYGQNVGGATLERFYSTDELQLTNKKNLENRLRNTIRNAVKPMVSFDYHDYTGRLDAITTAINLANPGDIIYIPGKGTEKRILFDNVEYEWSDYEASRLGLLSKMAENPTEYTATNSSAEEYYQQ